MGEETLTALMMLFIEKDLILEMPDFNQCVIDKFAAKKGKERKNERKKKRKKKRKEVEFSV